MENFKFTKESKVEMIGKKCVVSAIYHEKPNWERLEILSRPAWITGFGVIKRGYTDYDTGEGNIFICKETIKVVKVRFWTNEVEKNIPLDAFIIAENAVPFPSSWME